MAHHGVYYLLFMVSPPLFSCSKCFFCCFFFLNLTIFLPIAGMEELTLEQIKKKSDLEEDIDFENGGQLLPSCEISCFQIK